MQTNHHHHHQDDMHDQHGQYVFYPPPSPQPQPPPPTASPPFLANMQFSAYVPATPTPVVPSHIINGAGMHPFAHQTPYQQLQPDLHSPSSLGDSPPLYTPHSNTFVPHAPHGVHESPISFDPHQAPPLDVPGLSDTSTDGTMHSASQSSGPASPASARGLSLALGGHPHRYNPIATMPSPAHSSSSSAGHGRRRSSPFAAVHDDAYSDDERMMAHARGFDAGYIDPVNRKEMTRRQRIEAEQRRRDELRDSYERLRNVLPIVNQKGSKVALLERATRHILEMEMQLKILHSRVQAADHEAERLRRFNQTISETLSGPSTRSAPSSAPSPGSNEREGSLNAELNHIHLDEQAFAHGTPVPCDGMTAPPPPTLESNEPVCEPVAAF